MWDPKQDQEEEDSWVVRAFAEDTCNAMGTTWPPRYYTCTFCRRKFQSAQALGGHMNVHRRDRAELHQSRPQLSSISSTFSPTSSSAHLLASQELMGSGDLCFLYQLPVPRPNHAVSSQTVNPGSSHLPCSLISAGIPVGASCYSTCQCCSSNDETQETLVSGGRDNIRRNDNSPMGAAMEDIDLELRLGSRHTQSKN